MTPSAPTLEPTQPMADTSVPDADLDAFDRIASPSGTAAQRLQIPEMPLVAPGSSLRAVLRLTTYAFLTCLLAPIQGLALLLRIRPLYRRLPRVYHRICCRILGFRLRIRGNRVRKGPVLFVSNHISYLDIGVLGALIPASFVAKAEISRWPVFGWLAKLQRTVFVDRQRRTTAGQRDSLANRLDDGDSLILFPEGTSSDGNRVLPFKSALFSVAEQRPHGMPLQVQPVSIAYTRLDGMPIGRTVRPFFAWYGDMELHDHLWDMARLGICDVEIRFHPPVTIEAFKTRKALAEHCWSVIATGVSCANAGRDESIGRQADEETFSDDSLGAEGEDQFDDPDVPPAQSDASRSERAVG